jgi:hypothetical protein
MKLILLLGKYLPLIIQVVIAVEHTIQVPGETKAKIAAHMIQTSAALCGHTLPEEPLQKIISGLVEIFNATGVFEKTPAPLPAPTEQPK